MSNWSLETSCEFDRGARKIPRTDLIRIKRYLDNVAALDNPRGRGTGLTANRSGYWRYRIGNYRVIVEIINTRLIILAIEVGHRSTVYRDRS